MLEKIIATEHRNGAFNDIRCPDGDRLIVGYSDERAKKNAYDREQGVERLRKRYSKGTLTKSDINRRGRSVLPREHWMSDRCSTSRLEESKRMYVSASLH